jgi:hypothetical protein
MGRRRAVGIQTVARAVGINGKRGCDGRDQKMSSNDSRKRAPFHLLFLNYVSAVGNEFLIGLRKSLLQSLNVEILNAYGLFIKKMLQTLCIIPSTTLLFSFHHFPTTSGEGSIDL